MPNIELLDAKKHQGLCVQKNALDFSNVGNMMVFRSELESAQRHYPLFFQKSPETGQFYTSALFGFSASENLFLNKKNEWESDYIPMMLEKGPFVIGFQGDGVDKKPVVYLDVDHASVSSSDGEALFDDSGEKTSYLSYVSGVLGQMHSDIVPTENMIKTFASLDLIESVNLDISLDNGEDIRLNGLYTINEDSVMKLSAETLADLNSKGYLKNIFSIISSLKNLKYLIKRKNSQG